MKNAILPRRRLNISKSFMTFIEREIMTFIPYHRILEVKEKGTNEIIYSKK